MFTLGALGFTTPLLLAGLLALPVLWWLLRAVPPAPIRRRFPGIALLLGLKDDDHQTDKTPWWLLLLRMLAVAAFILGFAGPVLNPDEATPGRGPLLIAMDASWASARDWPARIARAEALVAEAGRDGRPVAVLRLSELPGGDSVTFQTAETVLVPLRGLEPAAWEPDALRLQRAASLLDGQSHETIWFSDGLDRPGRADLLNAFEAAGAVTVIESPAEVVALAPARFEDGLIAQTVLRNQDSAPRDLNVIAFGPDPNGVEQELARVPVQIPAGAVAADLSFDLPTELRNRVRRFQIEGVRSAGAVSLTDDALKRREVGLLAGREAQEADDLLSPVYYLNKALVPTADLIDGTLDEMLLANPDVLILADVARLSGAEADAVADWVRAGGLLVRFAGPRMAGAEFAIDDPLLPVRLRAGGRSVGGAMSWGEPKTLRSFTRDSPFFGLEIPGDVEITAQVVAEPGPNLAGNTIATLEDGTPLVTRALRDQGQVVLFHVTANAEWSSLPLSGLFVQMLERLAISTRPTAPDAEELAGTTWALEERIDAFGAVRQAEVLPGVPGETLAARAFGPELPPGLYAGEDRRLALNVIAPDRALAPANWPQGTQFAGLEVAEEEPLAGLFLAGAVLLLLADILASLLLGGRLNRLRPATLAALAAVLLAPQDLRAQGSQDEAAILATSEVVLAYVATADPETDRISQAGLTGLSRYLFLRTSVEPADPMAVDLESDELSFYPLIYWPVSESQPTPSAEAYAKLNRYLRTGGMIVFDTRDANRGGFGSATPAARRLQEIARPLDVPALEPVPEDHVLTRSFYLMQDFPGRFASRDVWVEAAPADAEAAEGLPFRDLNDGVTPVLIGGNDWAGAWAIDSSGRPLLPVGRGFAGERQREMAIRFGVNLVMHVLTGNYKSDQVHVPALLDRLGN